MAGIHVDAIDRRILREIQLKGDITSAELAETVGASAASCWRRVKRLEAEGVLGPVVRLANAKALRRGLTVFCWVRMKSRAPEDRAAFETFLANSEEIVDCYSISGEFDYQLRILTEDMDSYEAFIMRRLLTQTFVSSTSSQFALKCIKHTTAIPV
jgi:DNA-binding Lrp family transcriptional regulator